MSLSEVAACSGISYDTLLRAVKAADSHVDRKFKNPQAARIGLIFSELGGATVRVLASKILPVFGGEPEGPPAGSPDGAAEDSKPARGEPDEAEGSGPQKPARDRFGKKEAVRMRSLPEKSLAALLRSAVKDLGEANTAARRERLEAAVDAMKRRGLDVPQIVVRGVSIERMRRDLVLFADLGSFLAGSPPGSGQRWLFVRSRSGRPVDLFSASEDELALDLLEALTVDAYLEAFRAALSDERAAAAAETERKEIESFLDAEGPNPRGTLRKD